MCEEAKLLLTLQEKDQQAENLSAQMKRLDEQEAQVLRDLDHRRNEVDALRVQLAQLEQNSRMRNLEVDELDMEIRKYGKELDEGIISFKEMEALRKKIANQRERISMMEDEALSLMDQIESGKIALKEREEAFEKTTGRLSARLDEIASSEEDLAKEIASLSNERKELVKTTPSHLLDRYDYLHSKYHDPVAQIENGTCSGCKLKVSGNTVERARNSTEVVTCENCSRILYIS